MWNRNALSPPAVSAPSPWWWVVGVVKAAMALAIVYAPMGWFAARYRIVYDADRVTCLPYRFYLIHLTDRTPLRGEYFAFVSEQMEPFYPNGTLAVKLVAAVPGDHVTVNESGVSINGSRWGDLLHLRPGERLWRAGRRLGDVARDEIVPPRHLWMMGTHPRSFDSRYWGYIGYEQIVGRATPIW